jgi:hypothetical protein
MFAYGLVRAGAPGVPRIKVTLPGVEGLPKRGPDPPGRADGFRGEQATMTGLPNRTETSWAAIIAEAYAADTKPPLTAELTGRIRTDLAALDLPGGSLDGARIEAVNGALDAFELALEAVAGPRLVAAEAGGAVRMAHRSEAGHPLRSFGGQ